MSHFYGTLSGRAKTIGTRCGTKNSGIQTTAAGWGGAIKTYITHKDGKDFFAVWLTPWENSGGKSRLLAEGELNSNS